MNRRQVQQLIWVVGFLVIEVAAWTTLDDWGVLDAAISGAALALVIGGGFWVADRIKGNRMK